MVCHIFWKIMVSRKIQKYEKFDNEARGKCCHAGKMDHTINNSRKFESV